MKMERLQVEVLATPVLLVCFSTCQATLVQTLLMR
jgi:hypothetical protein